MPQNVSIAYRGAHYAIGQGPQFYAIWHAAAPEGQPIEWWPLTPDGWTAAWTRFASVEAPGTIVPVATAAAGPASGAATAGSAIEVLSAADRPAAEPADSRAESPRGRLGARIGAGLIAVGIALGVAGLFPAYVDGASLASQSSDLVPHLIYLAGWAASGVLLLLPGTRRGAGALLGLGVSVVTFGLFFADAGTPMSAGAHTMGAGLILSLIGWAACTAGAVLAVATAGLLRRARQAGRTFAGQDGRQSGHDLVPAITMVLAAVGAAVAFAPSWDRFLLQTANGASQTVTLGNAFSNPGPVIVGDVLVMVLLVVAIIAAVLWRPVRLGAALAAGAILPMVAQAISAVIQVSQPTPPGEFGISAAEARLLGLTITNGLTTMFWVYCAFVATLILLCVWMLIAPDPARSRPLGYPASPYQWSGPGGYPVHGGYPVQGGTPAAGPAAAAGQPASGQSEAGQPGAVGQPGEAGQPQPSSVPGDNVTTGAQPAPGPAWPAAN